MVIFFLYAIPTCLAIRIEGAAALESAGYPPSLITFLCFGRGCEFENQRVTISTSNHITTSIDYFIQKINKRKESKQWRKEAYHDQNANEEVNQPLPMRNAMCTKGLEGFFGVWKRENREVTSILEDALISHSLGSLEFDLSLILKILLSHNFKLNLINYKKFKINYHHWI